ncbi:hypothetical protein IFT69_24495 [Pseudomonas putida]|nr:hypothetical protein [Pseudomonas putida]
MRGQLQAFSLSSSHHCESKSQRNADRYVEIRDAVSKNYLDKLTDLSPGKQLYGSDLARIDRIADAWTKRMDISRFEGPFAARHVSALKNFVEAWFAFRDLIKFGPWTPASTQNDTMLIFNPSHFRIDEPTVNSRASKAEVIAGYWIDVEVATALVREKFLMLQLTGNLHMLELPFAGLLLRRRLTGPPFIGCSNFPQCTHRKRLPGM